MKAVLIVAILLMAGASIYGVVDYQKTAGTKNLKELYEPEKEVTKVTEVKAVEKIEEPKKAEPVLTKKETSVNKSETKPIEEKKKKKKASSKISLKKFSRAAMKE